MLSGETFRKIILRTMTFRRTAPGRVTLGRKTFNKMTFTRVHIELTVPPV